MSRLRIGELLVKAGLLTPEEVEEALRAQQIYGGRLGTNLVEHGLVSETDLAAVLGRQLGVPVITREALADVPPPVIALVPASVAERFATVPFQHDEARDRVLLAMADPTNLQLSDEIQFALGRRVLLHLGPEIVVARALEKYYGVHRERRFIKLDIGGGGARPAAAAPGEASGRPAGILGRLTSARTSQELLDTLVDALTAFGRQVAFLAFDGTCLVGWGARGLLVGHEQLAALSVPVAGSPTVHAALASRAPVRVSALEDPVLRPALADVLFIECDEPLVVVPLVVADRPLGVFVLARLDARSTADPRLLAELMQRAGWQLQALHLLQCASAPLAGCP
jgi:hypothetical protein